MYIYIYILYIYIYIIVHLELARSSLIRFGLAACRYSNGSTSLYMAYIYYIIYIYIYKARPPALTWHLRLADLWTSTRSFLLYRRKSWREWLVRAPELERSLGTSRNV